MLRLTSILTSLLNMSVKSTMTNMKFESASANVHLFNMFDDNYGYILQDRVTGKTAVIDPGEPEPVYKKCQELNINLDMILATHKHADHVGGVEYLVRKFPNIEII